jgi:vacuolar-type H+-ATPase subunit H
MENENTLDHLLKIEAEAAALVNDAQAEADRRIHENEEKIRAVYEERFKVEAHAREEALNAEKEKLKEQYQNAIDEYRREISNINVDVERFTSLFNEYVAGEG